MFTKIWVIIKDEVYRLVVDQYCFILLMFYMGIGYSLFNGNFIQYIPGLNELLKAFVENGNGSLWGTILLINSAAGWLGLFLFVLWGTLMCVRNSYRYHDSMIAMLNFCLRYYFYSAWLYLLTILGVSEMDIFDLLEVFQPMLGVVGFGVLSLFTSIIFSFIYLFLSHNVKYGDLEVS